MGMAMAHPIHLHGPQFRVLARSGGSPNALREGIADTGWTDTVLVLPGETVRVQVTFSMHPGLYLYHCHILEHEDRPFGMQRPQNLGRGPDLLDDRNIGGIWDGMVVEDDVGGLHQRLEPVRDR